MTFTNKTNIDLTINNACILTMDASRKIIRRGTVAIDHSLIIDVDETNALQEKYHAKQVIDANGMVLIPGLINTHTHIFQTFLRGFGQDLPAIEWLHTAIDPSVPFLGAEESYYSAIIGCLEAVKCGTTTLLEYNYANPVANVGDQVIAAFRDVGLRGIFARGILDTGDLHPAIIQNLDAEVSDCERLIQEYNNEDMMSVWIAPYTIMSASKNAFLKARELADKYHTRLTVHAATPSTIDGSINLYGMGDLAWEESIGFLGPDVLAVHCCAPLTDQELDILKKYDVKISHNPVSNCYLGEGIAQIKDMLDRDLCVSLATDGPGSNNNMDMMATLKYTALLQKVKYCDPTTITGFKVLEMATIDGAKAIGKEKEIGSVEVGKKADLVLLNLDLINTSFSQDPVASIVYSATQENVDTVFIDGKMVMNNRNILSVDESYFKNQAKMVAQNFIIQSGLLDQQ